jgi:Holliday junction resolvase
MAKKLHACSTVDSLALTTTPIQPMAHPSKRKANRHEREIVRIAEAKGFESERAYASNGESLGEVEACDVLVRGRDDNVMEALRIQAKRRASIASYLNPPEGTDAVVVREDRGENLAVLPLKDLLDLLTEE